MGTETGTEAAEGTPQEDVTGLPARALTLEDGVTLQPVEQLKAGLEEYSLRRNAFREWLMNQLEEGVHYGIPPGCEPKVDADGNLLQYNKKTRQHHKIDPKQWRIRLTLYQAGADLIIELLQVRAEFEADEVAWKMGGSHAGSYHFKCMLHSRTGRLIGQGVGADIEGGRNNADSNTAAKMACKRALVHAVIYTFGLSDLFTQDTRPPPIPKDAPDQDKSAPQVMTRAEREAAKRPFAGSEPTRERVEKIMLSWAKEFGKSAKDRPAFVEWVGNTTGITSQYDKKEHWTEEVCHLCELKLKDLQHTKG